MFAALALTAMVPAAASARGGGGGGGGHSGGGGGHFAGGGGHFSGGGAAHFSAARVSGGGGHFSSVAVGGGGVRFSAARSGGLRYGGTNFAATGRRVAFGGPGGWHHGHYYRRFAGIGAGLVAGAYLGAGSDYYDGSYYGDGSDYSDGSDGSCVWVRQLVLTYYGPSWQLVPVCYGY